VEQLSFTEFSQCLPSPTVMISMGMKPYEGNGVLEINPTLVFPILEMVLGGSGNTPIKVSREVTEIEQNVLDGIVRIILHDLRESWRAVSMIAFSVEGHETEPQLLQILAPTEAVVAVSMEVRIGESVGMMNIGVPSIIIKMLRHKFDQQWSLRKTESTAEEEQRALRLIQASKLHIDARLNGPTLRVENMMDLQEGDIIAFDYPVERPLTLECNGKTRFTGQVVHNGRKRVFLLDELQVPDRGERHDRRPLRTTLAEPSD